MSRLQASYVQDYAGFQNAIPEALRQAQCKKEQIKLKLIYLNK